MDSQARQSNFELLRLVSMLMVMVCHANGYVNETDLVGAAGATKLAVNQLCLVNVNIFVLISGWFGIKPSIKGFGKLLFQILFLSLLCFCVFKVVGLPASFKHDLLPYLLFGSGYWFVVSYLILYVLSPVLNAFVDKATKKEFALFLVLFFITEFIYGYALNVGHFEFGFSALFFIGLYLLARYVRVYSGKFFQFNRQVDLIIYLFASCISMLLLWYGYKLFGMGFHLNHYDSPLAIIAAIYLILFFSKFHFQSRIINWMASSAFAIYLIHENSLVSPYYHIMFDVLRDRVPLEMWYLLLFIIVLVLGLAFIITDKLRILIWNMLIKPSKQHV